MLDTEQKLWRLFHLQLCHYGYELLPYTDGIVWLICLVAFLSTAPLMLWYVLEAFVSMLTP